METFIGSGEKVTQILPLDITSLYYGTLDGYSFCSETYDFILEYKRDGLATT